VRLIELALVALNGSLRAEFSLVAVRVCASGNWWRLGCAGEGGGGLLGDLHRVVSGVSGITLTAWQSDAGRATFATLFQQSGTASRGRGARWWARSGAGVRVFVLSAMHVVMASWCRRR